jgi:hypothetical protein
MSIFQSLSRTIQVLDEDLPKEKVFSFKRIGEMWTVTCHWTDVQIKWKKKWASVVGQSLACGTCGLQSALTDYDEQKGMSKRKR